MDQEVSKYFLQFMLRKGYISLEDGLQFCNQFTDTLNSLNAFKKFISDINAKISKQELKISLLKCEVTGNMKLALITTANDDITKLQTTFTSLELQYFQALLKEMLETDKHRLHIMTCLNISSTVTGTLRKDNAEKVLEKWINGGYFVKKDSHLHLGTRCIAEFAPYFRIHCKELYTSCNLCCEPVFTGVRCNSCDKIMHKHCIEKYLHKQSTCPSCKTQWEETASSEPETNFSSSSDGEITQSLPKKKKQDI